MWVLIMFTFATTGAASTVTTLEFSTQQLCLIAAREIEALASPMTAEGPSRYKVALKCIQTSEVVTKK